MNQPTARPRNGDVLGILLFGLLVLILASLGRAQEVIHCFNDATQPRHEYVIWGSPQKTAFGYSQRGSGSWLNVAKVFVPGKHDGPVVAKPDSVDEPFTLHPALAKEFAYGFVPYAQINANRCDLELVDIPVVHPRLIVGVWRGRTPDAICELVTYTFHRQPSIRFEFSVFCESFAATSKQLAVALRFQTGPRMVPLVYDLAAPFQQVIGSWSFGDGQGARWQGALVFWTDEMLGNQNHPDTLTAQAQYVHPLFAAVKWPSWGPWGKECNPNTGPPPASRKDGPLKDPFAHLGFICNKRPRDTGEQAEFGCWHHVETVSSGNSRRLWEEHRAASREVCRPTHVFEPGGEWVTSARHPNWVTWDEVTHYHPVVSPDRLLRTHTGSSEGPSHGWGGHDRQHQGWQFLSEDILLTGSVANERLIRMAIQVQLAGETLPSMKPGWSTNSSDSSRGWGRTWIMSEFWRRALPAGDADATTIVDRMWKRHQEVVDPAWRSRWRSFGDPPIKPFELTPNPNGGALVGNAWNVWQDGIATAGADALRLSLLGLGRTADADKVLPMVLGMGRSVVLYGYSDDATYSLAYELVPDCQPLPNTTDRSTSITGAGTDFDVWQLMAVGCMERLDPSLRTRCTQIRTVGNRQGRARNTYLGSLLP